MNRRKKALWLTILFLSAASLTGCGKDAELEQFYTEMDSFTTQANLDFEALRGVDPSSETAVEDMLSAMDNLAVSFQTLADINVPKEFSAVESLADEAGSYMTEAAALYRQAYSDGAYDENVAYVALENYNRAIKRMDYISEILQGEMPTDDSITIITENDAPGFKEDAESQAAETETE